MSLSKKETSQLARLARLALTEEEIKQYTDELSSILEFIKQLTKVDVTGIESTSQVTGLMNVMRDDQENLESRISNLELEQMAPEFENGYVKVPKVL